MADTKSKTPKADKPQDAAAPVAAAIAVAPVVVSADASAAAVATDVAGALGVAPADPAAVPLPDQTDLSDPVFMGVAPAGLWSVYGQNCLAAVDVLKERCRQVEGEGFQPEQDDAYTDYQLPRAAICYAIKAAGLPDHRATLYWPFPPVAFKPADRRGSLVKAAALLLAEIERLDRAERSAV